VPWDDPSGDRLRQWTGLSKRDFYDSAKVALVGMGFCYPGKGDNGDLPPRPECAPRWHERVFALLPADRLTLLVGMYAQQVYLPRGARRSGTIIVWVFINCVAIGAHMSPVSPKPCSMTMAGPAPPTRT
jgi:uracil-DNA glycosylase